MWLKRLRRALSGRSRNLRQDKGRSRPIRLGVETLESRVVPTVYTPNAFADSVDAPGDPTMSLRDAVSQANADAGTADDTIQLGTGTYTLSLVASGDLEISNTSHALIIQGTGTTGGSATIIDASALQNRVFQITASGVTVKFQDLVIQ